MRRLFVFIVLACFSLSAFSQESSIQDTVLLEEVVHYGDLKKYQSGAKIEEISPMQVLSVQEGGIEQLLMRFTPIYVKSNAGGLATIHIRGTAADHTSILFGGININSLTLGSSDLSNITSFLFDRFQIQYGSSSALNGSGAIGGAIYLGVRNNWTDGVNVNAKYAFGSFGERLYGTKVYAGNGKWEFVTRLLKYKSENDFTYTNTNGAKATQDNAAIDNKGFVQEFNYLFGSNEYFKSMLWYEDSWHEIQPFLYNTTSAVTELKNDNIRFWSQYNNENNLLKFSLGAGFVHDKEIYNNDPNQRIQTDRLVADCNMKHQVVDKLEYKVGVKYKFISPDVYSYSDSIDLNEHDADLYLIWFYKPFPRFKTTVNLRQQLVSKFKAPFTPAMGIEYNWIHKEKNNLSVSLNASRSYRIPTFNDRNWPTAGNPNGTPGLKPEDGLSLEIGINYKYKKEGFSAGLKTNLFYMDIKNWLEWRNDNGPMPVNLERVISKGIEVHAKASLKAGEFMHSLTGNYTYNPSIKIEEGKPDQQLNYIPRHMFNSYYDLKYRNLSLIIDGSFTGKRFYRYARNETKLKSRKILDSYFLTNCVVNYNFKVKKQDFTASISANNIFNIDYQNQRYYAMPGINFKASLTANINFKNL